MDLQNHSTTSRLLIAGTILTFVIILVFTWPLFRRAAPSGTKNNQPMEVVPERTPAEIITSYQTELMALDNALKTTTASEASKKMNVFFFSVRVPEAARTAHLKAALEFQNTDVKKSDTQKLMDWQVIIKKLQTAMLAL